MACFTGKTTGNYAELRGISVYNVLHMGRNIYSMCYIRINGVTGNNVLYLTTTR